MKIFDDSVTDRVAEQFCLYFERKRLGKKMSYRDAADIIRYIQGDSSPIPQDISAIDYSETRVSGGGKSPPSENEVMRILERVADSDEWDSVFNEILALHSNSQDSNVIMLAFDKRKLNGEVSLLTSIPMRTVQDRKLEILTKSAILAGMKNLIKIFFAQR